MDEGINHNHSEIVGRSNPRQNYIERRLQQGPQRRAEFPVFIPDPARSIMETYMCTESEKLV